MCQLGTSDFFIVPILFQGKLFSACKKYMKVVWEI